MITYNLSHINARVTKRVDHTTRSTIHIESRNTILLITSENK